MKAVLELRELRVEGANAIAGLTWGFPAVSAFLGFCHALDRRLRGDSDCPPVLGGCAIVCHDYQLHSDPNLRGEHALALTRNPLTSSGGTAPFNEEGRMGMTVSLIVECLLSVDEYVDALEVDCDDDQAFFVEQVQQALIGLRLAGGLIVAHKPPRYTDAWLSNRRLMAPYLPGFALVDRSDLLVEHHRALAEHRPDTSLLEAWMDFGGVRYRAEHVNPEEAAAWDIVPKPEPGWFVPLMVGYQGIDALRPAGSVSSARDNDTAYCAVEPVHGVGQWVNPLRAEALEHLMWRYDYAAPEQAYRFLNAFPTGQSTESTQVKSSQGETNHGA